MMPPHNEHIHNELDMVSLSEICDMDYVDLSPMNCPLFSDGLSIATSK